VKKETGQCGSLHSRHSVVLLISEGNSKVPSWERAYCFETETLKHENKEHSQDRESWDTLPESLGEREP
jgi:hypothetical protein